MLHTAAPNGGRLLHLAQRSSSCYIRKKTNMEYA